MDLLKSFFYDVHTREAFKKFQLDLLREVAIKKVFDKDKVEGMAEAKDLIEQSFSELENIFGEKKVPNIESSR